MATYARGWLLVLSCSGVLASQKLAMGRSTRLQADENRMRILAYAEASLRSGGVSAINIADIMASAGMTQGGFYNHFPSKEALVVEACTAGFAQANRKWQAVAMPPGQPAAGAMQRLVEYYVAPKLPGQRCPTMALAQDAASDRASAGLVAAYKDGVRQLLFTFIGVAHADPLCSLTDEQLRLAFAAMVGANLLACATADAAWPAIMQQALAETNAR